MRLLLLERSTNVVDARVAIYVKGAGAVGYGVSVREDQDWWSGQLSENFAHDNLHGGGKLKLVSLRGEGGNRADPFGQITHEFAIVPHTA